MRWLYIFALILLTALLPGCSIFNKKIIYLIGKSEFVVDEDSIEMGSKKMAMQQRLSFNTYEINAYRKEPLKIDFIFTGLTPKIKAFENISCQLMKKTAA